VGCSSARGVLAPLRPQSSTERIGWPAFSLINPRVVLELYREVMMRLASRAQLPDLYARHHGRQDTRTPQGFHAARLIPGTEPFHRQQVLRGRPFARGLFYRHLVAAFLVIGSRKQIPSGLWRARTEAL